MRRIILASIVLVLTIGNISAQTYTVDNTDMPGDYYPNGCDQNWNYTFPEGSLAEALYQANQGTIDEIVFDFTGPTTINIPAGSRELPVCGDNYTITGPVDGDGNPLVTITGGAENSALRVEGASTIRIENLAFEGSPLTGIIVENNASDIVFDNVNVSEAAEDGFYVNNSTEVTIQNSAVLSNGQNQDTDVGTWSGINPNDYNSGQPGNAPNIEYHGIYIENADNFTIDGSVVSGNNGPGIFIDASNNANGLITNNIIGATEDGSEPLGNFSDGIQIQNSSGITVGTAGNGNHIAANGNRSAFQGQDIEGMSVQNASSFGAYTQNMLGDGVEVNTSSDVTISANFIGTDASGNDIVSGTGQEFGNHHNGIYITSSTNVTVGGENADDRNVIGGNGFAFDDVHTNDTQVEGGEFTNILYGVRHGVQIHDLDGASDNNLIINNNIGIGADGTSNIANSEDGVSILGFGNGSSGNLIEGNRIGGSNFAIAFQGPNVTNNTMINNIIGASDEAGTNLVPLQEAGIKMQNGANGNIIGEPGDGNIIFGDPNTNDTRHGVEIFGDGSIENSIRGNFMKCTGTGIDLRDGGNNEFGPVYINSNEDRDDFVSGLSPNEGDIIDIYLVDEECSETCTDEAIGQEHIGSITSELDTEYETNMGDGYWEVDLNSLGYGPDDKNRIVVTATDQDGNTSQFNLCENLLRCEAPENVTISSDDLDETVCAGDVVNLTANADNMIDENVYNYTWYIGSVQESNIISGPNLDDNTVEVTESGDYFVVISDTIDEDECTAQNVAGFEVEITEYPELNLEDGAAEVCENDENVPFSVEPISGVSFTWLEQDDISFNGSNLGANVEIIFGATDAEELTLQVAGDRDGCVDTLDIPVTIHQQPETATIDAPEEACDGDTITVNTTSSATNYLWTAENGTILAPEDASSVDIVLTSDGTSEITLTEESDEGCRTQDPATATVTVNSLPNNMAINGPAEVCEGATEAYEITDALSNSTFEWSYSDDATLPDDGSALSGEVTFGGNSGTLEITEISDQGCADASPASLEVTVNPRPQTDDITPSSAEVCAGGSATFTATNGDPSSTYEWFFDDNIASVSGADDENEITLTFSEAYTGQIGVIETETGTPAECSSADTIFVDYTVNGNPEAPELSGDFNPECNEEGVAYEVQDPLSPAAYIWSLPGGAEFVTDTTGGPAAVNVDFSDEQGNISVYVRDENGCVSEETAEFIVLRGCGLNANFDVTSNEVCEQSTLQFTDISTTDNPPVDSVRWEFGPDAVPETATSSEVEVIFTTAGTHTVTLRAYDEGVEDVYQEDITVNEKPVLEVSDIDGPSVVCPLTSEDYTFDDSGFNPEIDSYTWYDLSGSSVSSDVLTQPFEETGGEISLVVMNELGCEDTATLAVTLYDLPEAPTIEGPAEVCEDAQGEQYSVASPIASSDYEWTAAGASPETAAGEIINLNFTDQTAELTVTQVSSDGCSSPESDAFTVGIILEPEVPDISGDTTVCHGEEITYSVPEDPNVFKYTWIQYGEDQGVNSNEVSLSFDNTGNSTTTTTIRLLLDPSSGDQECPVPQTSQTIHVNPPPGGSISGGDHACEIEDTLEFTTSRKVDGYFYDWSIPQGATHVEGSNGDGVDNHTIELAFGASSGNVSVTIRDTVPFECTNEISKSVNVTNLVEPISTIIDSQPCDNNDYRDSLNYYFAKSRHATSYQWSFDNEDAFTSLETQTYLDTTNFDFAGGYRTDLVAGFDSLYADSTINVTIVAGNRCQLTDTVSFPIVIEKSYERHYTLITDPVCEEDTAEFHVVKEEPEEDTSVVRYEWIYEGETPQYDFLSDTTFIVIRNDTIFPADTIIVENGGETTYSTRIRRTHPIDTFLSVPYRPYPFESDPIPEVYPEFYAENGDTVIMRAYPKNCTHGELSTLTDTILADIRDIPEAVAAANGEQEELVVTEPQNIELNGTGSSEGDEMSYSWYYIQNEDTLVDGITGRTDLIANAFLREQRENYYHITVDNNYCTTTDSVKVTIDFQVFIPSAFSPNGDGVKDAWMIDNLDKFPDAQVEVRNRWGNVIFESGRGGFSEWDGTRNGEPLPMGTYFYVVKLNNGSDPIVGPVSIIK